MNRNGNHHRMDRRLVLDSLPYEGFPQMVEVCSMDLQMQPRTVAAMAYILVWDEGVRDCSMVGRGIPTPEACMNILGLLPRGLGILEMLLATLVDGVSLYRIRIQIRSLNKFL